MKGETSEAPPDLEEELLLHRKGASEVVDLAGLLVHDDAIASRDGFGNRTIRKEPTLLELARTVIVDGDVWSGNRVGDLAGRFSVDHRRSIPF